MFWTCFGVWDMIAVKKWSTFTKTKEVESFLGFANFYQQFIKNFSHIARSLNELKGKK